MHITSYCFCFFGAELAINASCSLVHIMKDNIDTGKQSYLEMEYRLISWTLIRMRFGYYFLDIFFLPVSY